MKTALGKLGPGAVKQIRLDHTHVMTTAHQYHVDTAPSRKRAIVATVCNALEIHAELEEEIFYPALREVSSDREVLAKSVPEHDEMRRIIARLRAMQPTDSAYDGTFMELLRVVMHHVADEETVLLPEAERMLAHRLPEISAQMTRRRLQLVAPKSGELALGTVRTMPKGAMLVAAGAVLAGTLVMRRAFGRHHHYPH